MKRIRGIFNNVKIWIPYFYTLTIVLEALKEDLSDFANQGVKGLVYVLLGCFHNFRSIPLSWFIFVNRFAKGVSCMTPFQYTDFTTI